MKRVPLLLEASVPLLLLAACGWNPKQPFVREAPAVKEAIVLLADAGSAPAAAKTLEDYLSTGECKDGNIGTPDLVSKRPDGTFDLGLALFRMGESFGRRFGDEEVDAGVTDVDRQKRHSEVECALRLLRAISRDDTLSATARAETHYLDGNLKFLDAQYEEAVAAYDAALAIVPGLPDAGLAVGRNAAYNRAIALRRVDDEKNRDAGHDSGPSDGASGDGGGEQGDAGGGGGDSGSPNTPDSGKSPPDGGDDGASSGGKPDAAPPPPAKEDGGAPPPSVSQDDRILDMLENSAPTVQQEEAKQRAGNRRVRGSADR